MHGIFLSEILKARDYLRGLGVYGEIILKWIHLAQYKVK